MICDPGDVVAVPFPFVDRPQVKRRPAVVVSTKAFNAQNHQTVLAMVTTGARSSWPSDLPVSDLVSAGLSHASVIRWKVFTLPNDLIAGQAGRLGPGDAARFGETRRAVLGG